MLLAPQRIARGYRFTFAYTVDDLETLKELTETGEGALRR
jgi:hypothetical protein